MRSPTRALRHTLAGLSLAGLILSAPVAITAAGAATAAPTAAAAPVAPSAPGDGVGPRVERACLRIPNLEIRVTNVKERLDGDATVRGSLAWLQTKIDAAEAAGRNQMATVLENRLEVRTKTREILDLRTEDLSRARTWCEDLGVEI